MGILLKERTYSKAAGRCGDPATDPAELSRDIVIFWRRGYSVIENLQKYFHLRFVSSEVHKIKSDILSSWWKRTWLIQETTFHGNHLILQFLIWGVLVQIRFG